ncbi:MAG TPA: SCO family protein [Blastocatellia bacterium]|nr:SCO family protein [Blastocatellia bacterium]
MRDELNQIGLIIFAMAVNIFLAGAVAAQTNQGGESPSQKYFTDVVLMNQYGQPMRLYTDLLKGRVVVINTFFTTCTSVCPPMTHNLTKVQDALGDRLGKGVFIISITVDPLTDTPAKLKEYAAKFKTKPGWYFLGGKKENVEFALSKLGQFVEARDDHSTVIIIGNEPTGLWKKAFGLAKPDALIEVVNSVVNDKLEPAK